MSTFSGKSLLLIPCIIFMGTLTCSSQVVINEIGVANYNVWPNAEFYDGWFSAWMPRCEDWIELYNTSANAEDISGYWLSDNMEIPMKWQFPEGTFIAGNDRLIVLLSGTGDYDPDYGTGLNTNFKITQTGDEELLFSDPDGVLLESYDFTTWGACQANHSRGRITDGDPVWGIFPDATEDAPNGGEYYNAYSPTPLMNYPAGYNSAPIELEITSVDPDVLIYYTLDCSDPSVNATLYTGPIYISETTVVRAIAIDPDPSVAASFIETNTYFFNDDTHSLFTVSVSGPIIADFQWAWEMLNELCTVEIFSPGGVFLTEGHGDMNEHGNDSNAYPQRGFDYIARDALGYDHDLEGTLFHSSGRDRFERLIFKAAGNDNYPFETDPDTALFAPLGGAHIRDAYVHELALLGDLHVDPRKTASCIVYINGVYSGVYEMREKVDDSDFTNEYYDQPKGYVDFIKQWAWVWEEMGSGQSDWDDLVEFIETNDMTLAANYDYVTSQYNTASLIDYFILNSYVVCADWLNWNTAWWRGKHPDGEAKRWRYALWDEDATFNHYFNYTGVPDQSADADPCQIEQIGVVSYSGHETNIVILLQNETFFADYVQRYAALYNTLFSCEQMHASLDSMVNVIAPEMYRHCDYWGGSYEEWMVNVNAMHDFIEQRCNNVIEGIEDCYDITAFTVTVQIEGMGEVEINTAEVGTDDTPWTGTYFGDVPIDLEAIAPACAEFIGWEIISGSGVIEDPENAETNLIIEGDITIQATFEFLEGNTEITLDVEPVNSGSLELNGNTEENFPTTESVVIGDEQMMTAIAGAGFYFDHWETGSTIVSPDIYSPTITFYTCEADSIKAIFTTETVVISEGIESVFMAFPNPANEMLVVQYTGESSELSLYNMMGSLVMQERLRSNQEFTLMNVRPLSNGLYLLTDGQQKSVHISVVH